jgi:hypothetical protein
LTLIRVDAARGIDVAGPRPDPFVGSGASLHGWRTDGTAVVSLWIWSLRRPEPDTSRSAIHSKPGTFGGPAPTFGGRLADWLGPNRVAVTILAGLAGGGRLVHRSAPPGYRTRTT